MELKEEKTRDSNLELLRIVSMFFIVIYHFLIHTVIPNNPQWDYITKPTITTLHIGVLCFVMISGFWGIKFSLKRFLKLFIQCVFYSILIFAVSGLLKPEILTLENFSKTILPDELWFIPVYMALYLLSPIINIPLKTKSTQKKLMYIILLAIVSYIFRFIPGMYDGKNPVNFIFIYYIGNFLRHIIKLSPNITTRKLVLIYLAVNLLLFIYISTFWETYNIGITIVNHTFPYNSIGLAVNAALFFLIFQKLKIKSKIINWIAISILPVYLIHENKYVSTYLYQFVHDSQMAINNTPLFLLFLIGLALSVLIVCILIDKMIGPVIALIEKLIFRIAFFKKVNSRLDAVLHQED